MPPHEPGRSNGLIDATADWLMTQALGDTSMERLVEGCCARLWGAGVPLHRVMIGYRTLHPLFTGVSHVWRRDAPLTTERHDQRQPDAAAAFERGPHGWMLRSGVSYLRQIAAAIESSDVLIVIVSYNAIGSKQIIVDPNIVDPKYWTARGPVFVQRPDRRLEPGGDGVYAQG